MSQAAAPFQRTLQQSTTELGGSMSDHMEKHEAMAIVLCRVQRGRHARRAHLMHAHMC